MTSKIISELDTEEKACKVRLISATLRVKTWAALILPGSAGNDNKVSRRAPAVDSSTKTTQTEGYYEKKITSEFTRAIQAGQAISPTVDEGLKVLRIIDTIYRSAEEGRQVDLA